MAEEIIIVQGNGTLRGEVAVSGAKNSALKLDGRRPAGARRVGHP